MAMGSIPKPDAVNAYLQEHKLESVIEDAVNDAVSKMVQVIQTPYSKT